MCRNSLDSLRWLMILNGIIYADWIYPCLSRMTTHCSSLAEDRCALIFYVGPIVLAFVISEAAAQLNNPVMMKQDPSKD